MRKYCKALVNLGVAFIILALIVFLVPKLLVFFAPFVAGWIIALIASPLVRFFEEKVKIKRKAGSAFVIVAVIALCIAFAAAGDWMNPTQAEKVQQTEFEEQTVPEDLGPNENPEAA